MNAKVNIMSIKCKYKKLIDTFISSRVTMPPSNLAVLLQRIREYINRLLNEYNYLDSNIRTNVPVPVGSLTSIADLVISTGNGMPYILVKIKERKQDDLTITLEQQLSLATALDAKYVVITDGYSDLCYKVKLSRAHYILEEIHDIPSNSLITSDSDGIEHSLVRAIDLRKVLSSLYWEVLEMYRSHDFYPVEVLEQFLKIIVAKVYDERSQKKMFFMGDENENIENVKLRMRELLERANTETAVQIFGDTKISLPSKILSHIVFKLQKYSLIGSGIQELAMTALPIEHILRRTALEFYTPFPISEFMVNLAGLREDIRILDPACGTGILLVLAAHKGASVFGIDANVSAVMMTKVNLFLSKAKEFRIFRMDSLQPIKAIEQKAQGISSGNFDCIITHPPFGMKIYGEKIDYFITGKTSTHVQFGEALFLEQSWHLLKEGGRLVIVVPDGLLSNDAMLSVRKFMLEGYRVISITSLPAMTFYPITRIKSSVLVLEKIKLRKFDTGYPFLVSAVENIGYDRNGKLTDKNDLPSILDAFNRFNAGDLNIKEERIFVDSISDSLRLDTGYYINQYENSGLRKIGKPLGEIAIINPGVRISTGLRSDNDNSSEKVEKPIYIRAQNVKDFEVYTDSADRVHYPASRNESVFLNEKDILITRTGTVGNVGMVKHDVASRPVIYSDNVIRIRIKDKNIDPHYLLAFLASDLGQTQIRQYTTGAAIKSISVAGIEKVLVPLLPMNIQNEISLELFKIVNLKRMISKQEGQYQSAKEKLSNLIKDQTLEERDVL
jgi:type I restriction enzyme M protein